MNPRYKPVKRALDIVVGCLSLLLLWPIALIAILAVFIEDPSASPIFVQKRTGKGEKPFLMYKIRTMRPHPDESSDHDDERLLRIGQILRRSSIDELPQILNVLKGEMSFIGPRPWLMKLLPYYSDRERRRHLVQPGMSGLAQVNGRNSVDFVTRLAYDIEYVENMSFMLDAKIFLKTIHYVFFSSKLVLSVSEALDLFDGDLCDIRQKEQEGKDERTALPVGGFARAEGEEIA